MGPRGTAQPDLATLYEILHKQGVAKFKIPEQVAIWSSLPKNDAGKVLKHKLRETLMQSGGLHNE
jgi:non-ribosomal peptide synthetase component E (peptide arylation enzyme)